MSNENLNRRHTDRGGIPDIQKDFKGALDRYLDNGGEGFKTRKTDEPELEEIIHVAGLKIYALQQRAKFQEIDESSEDLDDIILGENPEANLKLDIVNALKNNNKIAFYDAVVKLAFYLSKEKWDLNGEDIDCLNSFFDEIMNGDRADFTLEIGPDCANCGLQFFYDNKTRTLSFQLDAQRTRPIPQEMKDIKARFAEFYPDPKEEIPVF
ncbi:hypothetical protein HZA39_00460 [Candidatus Peregrinibacteria bacterium]|nr:hypothetical protein [Candidatus Peregrinibacteria bacterium]